MRSPFSHQKKLLKDTPTFRTWWPKEGISDVLGLPSPARPVRANLHEGLPRQYITVDGGSNYIDSGRVFSEAYNTISCLLAVDGTVMSNHSCVVVDRQ